LLYGYLVRKGLCHKFKNIEYNRSVNFNMNYGNVNPKNFDPKIKNQIMNQNIYHSGYGNYKMCPTVGSIRFPYKNSYDPKTINEQCSVVVCNANPLDIAYDLCDHGLNSLQSTKPIPAIAYPVGKEFIGTNLESREGIYDENIILRTNYPYVIKKQPELFTGKENQHSVIYSNPITTIRDANYNPMGYDMIFKTAIITVCFDKKNDLITEKIQDKEQSVLQSNDLLNFQIQMETVFQVAICGFHNVLILQLFGKEFGIPVSDQLLIFNMLIMKYGHKFKGIMVCVPPYEGVELFELFDRMIIRPTTLTQEIDMKYKASEMAQVLVPQNDDNLIDTKKDRDTKDSKLASDMVLMNDDDRMELLKKIIKNKKKTDKKEIKSK
jgi:hypothetical protein